MAGYAKLFSRILDSTVWRENNPTRILWITMLALADRYGIVQCTIPGLADRAKISLDECEYALERFKQPDKYSWSKDDGGRRIREVEGGWFLINHEKFRSLMSADETREKTRIRVARHRSKDKEPLQSVTSVTSNASNDIASASTTTTVKAVEGLNAVNTQNKIYKGEVLSEIPPDQPALNYAIKIIDDLGMTSTMANKLVVEAAVKALVKAGKSGPAAYEFLVAQAKDALGDGIAVDKFWFEDSKWRNRNGRQTNKAVQRDINNKAAILDGFGFSEQSAAVRSNVRSGDNAGGAEAMEKHLRIGPGGKA